LGDTKYNNYKQFVKDVTEYNNIIAGNRHERDTEAVVIKKSGSTDFQVTVDSEVSKENVIRCVVNSKLMAKVAVEGDTFHQTIHLRDQTC